MRIAAALGQPAATAIAADDVNDRYFIAEAVLTAAALFVLKKYADGFLKGLGVERLGEEHGELAIRTLRDAHEALAEYPERVIRTAEILIETLRTKVTPTARLQAEEAVQRELIEHGLPQQEAAEISVRISTACGLDEGA